MPASRGLPRGSVNPGRPSRNWRRNHGEANRSRSWAPNPRSEMIGSSDEGDQNNFLTALKLCRYDLRSRYESLLILLAKRFNTAYDLLLNTGVWSGGETSSGLMFVRCGGNAPNCRTPKFPRQ